MNGPTHRFLIPLLAVAIPLTLGGCRLLPKKEPAPVLEPAPTGEQKDGAAAATAESTPVPPADPQQPAAAPAAAPAEKKEDPAAKLETAAPPADPLKAEEFKKVPKREAEFILACRTAGATDQATVVGRDNLIFATGDLRALGNTVVAGSPPHQALVATIAGYAARLKSSGIEFVLAPVPPKPVVYPDYVSVGAEVKNRRHDSFLKALYRDLEKAGVRVVDLTDELRSGRFDRRGASFPRGRSVWSPRAAALAAEAVFKSVRRTEAAKTIVRDTTIVTKRIGVALDGEILGAESVGRLEGERIVAAAASKDGAPVLVIGDANAAAHGEPGRSAGLGDQLSLAFGAPVQTRSEADLGWERAPGLFSPKQDDPTKVVVWAFSAIEFLPGQPAAAAPPAPAAPVVKPPRRGTGTPASPRRRPASPSSLKLRDDPGLDMRPQ